MKSRRALCTLLFVASTAACSVPFQFTDDAGSGDAGTCLRSGECQCESDLNCGGAQTRCASDGRCVECLSAGDCGVNGLCDSKTRRCTLSCSVSADCTADTRDHCEGDLPNRHCVACEDQVLCPGGQRCAESVGFCVDCVTDSHCDAGSPRCDRRSGTCVQCLAASDCTSTQLCAVATGQCRLRP